MNNVRLLMSRLIVKLEVIKNIRFKKNRQKYIQQQIIALFL